MPRFSGYILKTKESRIIIEKLKWLSICTRRKKVNQAKNWKNQYGPFYKITRMYQCHRIFSISWRLAFLFWYIWKSSVFLTEILSLDRATFYPPWMKLEYLCIALATLNFSVVLNFFYKGLFPSICLMKIKMMSFMSQLKPAIYYLVIGQDNFRSRLSWHRSWFLNVISLRTLFFSNLLMM